MLGQWKEQMDACYRCCATWGETVIRVECNESTGNGTGVGAVKEEEKKKEEDGEGEGKEKDRGRELGFS
jgi:hypothetical protein